MKETARITLLLRRAAQGDSSAEELLFPLVDEELRKIAGSFFRRERPGHTLQPTALVNEVYLRLALQEKIDWKCRAHFFAMAAITMRRILVDHARKRQSEKRGSGGQRVDFEDGLVVSEEKLDVVLAVDQALNRLAKQDDRQAKIVEMRFFGGLTEEEIGVLLGVSERTVKRDWAVAKQWLRLEMGEPS